ncbi:MAG: GntR family transcriptional regulator, partial [Phycisphaeraceae bacterium]
MGETLTPRVEAVEAALQRRLRSGLYQPGDRFMSNRAIARQYGISYQTAHRLLTRLVDQGLLHRRDRSGTYVPGPAHRPTHVQLIFHRRARVRGSFGAKLLDVVRQHLIDAGLGEPRINFDQTTIHEHALPVLWEAPEALNQCLAEGRRAIMINDRPAPGINAMRIDSVATDDFVGGVLAAQYLSRLLGNGARCMILAGPRADRRSQSR